MYESPICLLVDKLRFEIEEQLEKDTFKAIQRYEIAVDKEELLRALQYDRGQYEKGYADGQRDAVKHGRWKLHSNGSGTCDRCHFTQKNVWDYDSFQKYCGVCGAKMDLEDTT